MAQLLRLRANLDAHEKVFATVDGLAKFISSSHNRDGTCAIRMCFLRGDHFSTERHRGTHLEFVDAESARCFDELCRVIKMLPINVVGREICRLTVWEPIDLDLFVPGTVYEVHRIFNYSLYNHMPQASVPHASAEACTATSITDADDSKPPETHQQPAQQVASATPDLLKSPSATPAPAAPKATAQHDRATQRKDAADESTGPPAKRQRAAK